MAGREPPVKMYRRYEERINSHVEKAGSHKYYYFTDDIDEIRDKYGSVSEYEAKRDAWEQGVFDIKYGYTQPMTAREALNSVVPQAVDYAMAVVRGSRTTGLGGSSERLGGYEETLG